MRESGNDARRKDAASLDIFRDKERYIRQISDSIASRLPDVNKADIEARVNQQYDNLLMSAKVLIHIPNLIEGQVRAEFRKRANKRQPS